MTDASIDMGAAFEAGIKKNFPNAEITFDKFHVIKLANEAFDQVRREEARNNFQIKGRRYIFLKPRKVYGTPYLPPVYCFEKDKAGPMNSLSHLYSV